MKKEIQIIMIIASLLLVTMSGGVQGAPLIQGDQGDTSPQNAIIHVVGWGDTLYSVSRLYGVSVEEIMRLNNMTDPNYVSVGQKLYITAGQIAEGRAKLETDVAVSSVPNSYMVQRGDTLYSIARRFGSTVSEMAQLNNIYDPTYIYVGQVLAIPGVSAEPAPTHSPADAFPTATPVIKGEKGYYSVRPGDSLSAIAVRYGTTAQVLAMENNIANPALIHVGQRLTIPSIEGAPEVATTVSTPVVVSIMPNAPIVPSALSDTQRAVGKPMAAVSSAPTAAVSAVPAPTGTIVFRAAQWPTATPGPANVPTLIPLEEKWLYRPVYPAPNLPDLPCRGGHIAGIVYDVNGVPLEGTRVKIYNEWDYETISVSKGDKEPGVFDFVISGEGWWDMVIIDAAGQAVSSAVTVQYAEDVAADGPTCQNHVHWYKTK